MRGRLLSIFFILFWLVAINTQIVIASDLSRSARTLYNQGSFAQAISIYQEIIKDSPRDIKAYVNLAYLYKDLAEYKQAIRILGEVPEALKDVRIKKLLGRLYYLIGKPKQAISQLKQLLPSQKEDFEVLFCLGQCYEEIDDFPEAQAFYLDAAAINPGNALVYLRLGNIYYASQMFRQAAQANARVIFLDSSISGVRLRLAECFTKLDEFTLAYKQYAKCVAIYPEDKFLRKKLKETKAKLSEDFFKQKKALAQQRRRRQLAQVKPSVFAKQAPLIRVGIAGAKDLVEFKCGSDFEIVDKQKGTVLFNGKEELVYSLVFNPHAKNFGVGIKDCHGKVLAAGLESPFLIKNKPCSPVQGDDRPKNSVIAIFNLSCGTGNFWAGFRDQQYRGIIEVIPDDNGFQLINLVNLEEYLYGVLPSEMPVGWPEQALRTQAVAARTWAVSNLRRHNRQGFNFCREVHCQVYKGAGSETQRTNQAVDDTAGIILTGEGFQPRNITSNTTCRSIDIFYSNNCGGCTQDGVVDALSVDYRFPLSPLELEDWLAGRPDTFCNLKGEKPANFRWVRLYKQKELKRLLGKFNINVGQVLKIIPQVRESSSHLSSVKIEGTQNTEVIKGENKIRKILGNLRSSAFKIEVKYNQQNQPQEFIFYGGGFGHGRGLCQTGIKGLALKGYDYLEILKHYYPEAEIKKIYQ